MHHSKFIAYCAIGCAVLLVSAVAPIQPLEISQQNRRFAPEKISLLAGEKLRVLNDDRFIHHVFYKDGKKQYDSGDQRPGETIEMTFPGTGDYMVLCAIHPKMKLAVTVTDQ